MSPESIIGEARKLPLHALEKVAQALEFELLGRLQENGGDQTELGRCPQ